MLLLTTLLFVNWKEACAGETLTFQSTEERTLLLELFTSQGCSSCPPAERWLNQFVDHPGLWSEVVPVVFHVNYWDRLGWKDPFADKRHTARQYSYSNQGKVRNVYTPCFISNGNEWRGWFKQESLPSNRETSGILRGQITQGQLTVQYSEEIPLSLSLAILGFDLTTDVKSGENHGKNLEQQFVVLNHVTAFSENGRWSVNLTSLNHRNTQRIGLAVWISKDDELTPIQATGTWLDKSFIN